MNIDTGLEYFKDKSNLNFDSINFIEGHGLKHHSEFLSHTFWHGESLKEDFKAKEEIGIEWNDANIISADIEFNITNSNIS